MRAMFQQCFEIKNLNLSSFNTSNVTDLSLMFQECFNLRYVDISNFSTENIKDLGWMFNKCYKLEEIKGINILINLKNIKKTGIFEDCQKLKDNPDDIPAQPIQIDKKQMIVIFTSIDQSIRNYKITCFNTDIFETLKEKIYLINPKMKNKQLYFIADGNIINERVSLAANKIKDETTILIDQQDFD